MWVRLVSHPALTSLSVRAETSRLSSHVMMAPSRLSSSDLGQGAALAGQQPPLRQDSMKKLGSYNSQQTKTGVRPRKQARMNDGTIQLTWPAVDQG
jgi:hypothetical protein